MHPTLLAEGNQKQHEYLYREPGGNQAIRPLSGVKNMQIQLYNLNTDIEEKTNIAEQNPEIVKKDEAIFLLNRE